MYTAGLLRKKRKMGAGPCPPATSGHCRCRWERRQSLTVGVAARAPRNLKNHCSFFLAPLGWPNGAAARLCCLRVAVIQGDVIWCRFLAKRGPCAVTQPMGVRWTAKSVANPGRVWGSVHLQSRWGISDETDGKFGDGKTVEGCGVQYLFCRMQVPGSAIAVEV